MIQNDRFFSFQKKNLVKGNDALKVLTYKELKKVTIVSKERINPFITNKKEKSIIYNNKNLDLLKKSKKP